MSEGGREGGRGMCACVYVYVYVYDIASIPTSFSGGKGGHFTYVY